MAAKDVKFGENARVKLLSGVNAVSYTHLTLPTRSTV